MPNVLRNRAAVAALVFVSVAVAGCTGETPGTATPTPGTSPSSAAPDDPNVPKVANPLDASAFVGDACKLLPAAAAAELGFPEPGEASNDTSNPACSWHIRGKADGLQLILGSGNREKGMGGIAGLRKAKDSGQLRFLEPGPDVDGYPTVYYGLRDRRASGNCDLAVGIADDLTFSAHAGGYDNEQESCGNAQKAASAVIKTLKGA
ncbi:DUF3558 domain-containing protein [Amycolatopsis keratiniphila]|uniref:DUF3558 domain-containing protein n=1 Tax=Amycolatopsis keratiniphila TaxID=129921 RepID=UPI000907AAD6|nr:DUF3558 domain-containing protein [Amycolatopsis keratiniphila]OLZ49538.1 hypothetical protein BS330_29790 [Amycolatopsis keratiniphila subsp. nogabecina]